MGQKKFLGVFLFSIFLAVALFAGGCGEDLKATNERLRKEVADLTADNDKLRPKPTASARRSPESTARSRS